MGAGPLNCSFSCDESYLGGMNFCLVPLAQRLLIFKGLAANQNLKSVWRNTLRILKGQRSPAPQIYLTTIKISRDRPSQFRGSRGASSLEPSCREGQG
jgi:hypothetical protein